MLALFNSSLLFSLYNSFLKKCSIARGMNNKIKEYFEGLIELE